MGRSDIASRRAVTGPGLPAYLVVGAILFGVGVAAVLSQRGAIMVVMGIEIMLNASVLNLIAFWRFVRPEEFDAQVFVIVLMTVAAVELAAGLGLILLIYRQRGSQNIDKLADMKG